MKEGNHFILLIENLALPLNWKSGPETMVVAESNLNLLDIR